MSSEFQGCAKYKDCEAKGDCPYDAQAIMANTMESVGMTVQQLQRMPICMEKIVRDEQDFTSQNPYQRAAFLLSTLWEPNETIKVSFMPVPRTYPGNQPKWEGTYVAPRRGDIMAQWYTRSQVNSDVLEPLTPEEEAFEKRVREMEPMDSIRTIVMEKIQPLVGVKFEFVESDGDIRIGFDNRQGAFSVLGTQCRMVPPNQMTLNLGWLDVATTIHEFCHALGMIHEHQNPFGKGIDWNIPKVIAWVQSTQGDSWDLYTICTNIFMKYNINAVNGSNYDSKSIMLYSYPGEVTNDNRATFRNIRLSNMDKKWLSSLYPPDASPRTFPSRVGEEGSSSNQTQTTIGDTIKTNLQKLQRNLQKFSILGLDPRWSVLIVVFLVMIILSLLGYIFNNKK